MNIQAPPDSGSLFHNYKGYFSLVLLALVDHQYKFTFIDVGEYGSNSDSSIFRSSNFGTRYLQGDLDVPPPKALPNFPNQGTLPHCIVGDEAFPLRMDLMRPYPRSNRAALPQDELVFNYRLSRARRIVENAFGILAQRFRIFNRRMQLSEHNGEIVIKVPVLCIIFSQKICPLQPLWQGWTLTRSHICGGMEQCNQLTTCMDITQHKMPFMWGISTRGTSTAGQVVFGKHFHHTGIVQSSRSEIHRNSTKFLTRTVHTYVRVW